MRFRQKCAQGGAQKTYNGAHAICSDMHHRRRSEKRSSQKTIESFKMSSSYIEPGPHRFEVRPARAFRSEIPYCPSRCLIISSTFFFTASRLKEAGSCIGG